MADLVLSMPLAVPPAGVDPTAFYATFEGKLTASWTPAAGLNVWLAEDREVSQLYAPVNAALRFVPKGGTIGSTLAISDTLVLQTWPTTYVEVKKAITSPAPAEIRLENVDARAVRSAVQPLFASIGRSDIAVEAFLSGEGLLRVAGGALVGNAALGENPTTAETPNSVKIQMFDGSGNSLNPVQFLSDAAIYANIDPTTHPLLSNLNLDGWVEIIVMDTSNKPIASESYQLYLADGTSRTGTTDANGRIFETDIPAGDWALDLPNYPSFTLLD